VVAETMSTIQILVPPNTPLHPTTARATGGRG